MGVRVGYTVKRLQQVSRPCLYVPVSQVRYRALRGVTGSKKVETFTVREVDVDMGMK